MPPDVDVSPIVNGWQALAVLGSTFIVGGFGWLAQRAKAKADRAAESEKVAALEVQDRVGRVPELLDTVEYLTEQLRIQVQVNQSVQRKFDKFERRFSEIDSYHSWLESNMPRPPFLTLDEFLAKKAAGGL